MPPRRRARPAVRCCWPGCSRAPLIDGRACPEHAPLYARMRGELEAPRGDSGSPVKRKTTVRRLCAIPDCDEFRKSGSTYCATHDDDR